MNHQLPLSVLMPVYNGEEYLSEAIDSVLAQTFGDFEFLIINDGSTDNSEQIIKMYADKDERVRYVENEKNLGLVPTLNKGLKLARGKYLARMDADDISLKERFSKQVLFMEQNPEVSICGTSYKSFGVKEQLHILPEKHESIKASLLFGSSMCHPSVMFRRSFVSESNFRYKKETWPAEDYNAWCEAVNAGILHNLQDVLLLYREHQAQISSENVKWQKEQTDKIRLEMLYKLSPDFNKEEKDFHIDYFVHGNMSNIGQIKRYKQWIIRIQEQNNQLKNYDIRALKTKLQEHLMSAKLRIILKTYFNESTYNFRTYAKYLLSGDWVFISYRQNFKILFKTIQF